MRLSNTVFMKSLHALCSAFKDGLIEAHNPFADAKGTLLACYSGTHVINIPDKPECLNLNIVNDSNMDKLLKLLNEQTFLRWEDGTETNNLHEKIANSPYTLHELDRINGKFNCGELVVSDINALDSEDKVAENLLDGIVGAVTELCMVHAITNPDMLAYATHCMCDKKSN